MIKPVRQPSYSRNSQETSPSRNEAAFLFVDLARIALATSFSQFSGPEGLRSPYLSYAIAALYQLSYRPYLNIIFSTIYFNSKSIAEEK